MRKKIFIYLASQSERRRSLLKKMGISFKVIPSSYREIHRGRGKPHILVMQHALGKARGAKLPGKGAWHLHFRCQAPFQRHYHLILGADTLVYFQGRMIGKPQNLKAAEKLLRLMTGRTHWVYSGIALIDRKTGREKVAYEKTRVKFKKWSAEQIRACLKRVNPLDKAGAYAIQDRPSMVARIWGSHSNVVGLPTELLRKLLQNF